MTSAAKRSYGHSLPVRPEEEWEPLADHLSLTAEIAGMDTPDSHKAIVQATALLHDIGKASDGFRDYIRRPMGLEHGPDHSTAGAQIAYGRYGPLGQMIAQCIAGHHGGLPNAAGVDGKKYASRLGKATGVDPDWIQHVPNLPRPEDMSAIPVPQAGPFGQQFGFHFMVRMLFSRLVDADFLATESFYAAADGLPAPSRGGVLLPEHGRIVDDHLQRIRSTDTEVSRIRTEVQNAVLAKAGMEPGLFTLTVPTGGGKTLTSLGFAMRHAAAHSKRRLVYVLPYTSIIEQTAKVLREDVGLGTAVLEHHSGFDWDEAGSGEDGARMRRDAENWDAPIVVTTAVQFFESLFSNRPSKTRKLHNLADSVIILDEAQTIPLHLLNPCLAVIDELARNQGATVILCTATQPAVRVEDGALKGNTSGGLKALEIPDERELTPDPAALHERLKRIIVKNHGVVADAEIVEAFRQSDSMMCIVNSRAHASELHRQLECADLLGTRHLTTSMCAAHRRQALASIRKDLDARRPVRLIATSLVEAGVDISFKEVWRAEAGLASIAQAAGRCNRSGELGPLGQAFGRVVVFQPDGQRPSRDVRVQAEASRSILRRHDDPLSIPAMTEYHRTLYWRKGADALDQSMLRGDPYSILGAIAPCRLEFPFADIAEAFRMIDDRMQPVIIPWNDEARELIERIRDGETTKAIMRKIQPYIVQIPDRDRDRMEKSGAISRSSDEDDRFMILEDMKRYSDDRGLDFQA